MYVGLARDLQGVLYRYQHLDGRQAMRDRIASGQATWASWTECAHPATPPSLEVLAIQRYRPPWNTQHNPNPRAGEDAVAFDAEEQKWLSLARDELDNALARVTSEVASDPSDTTEADAPPADTSDRKAARDKEPLLRGADTCRSAVLLAMRNLERRTGRTEFQLQEIVAEVMAVTKEYQEGSIRTHVASLMCANAPHNETTELTRVSRGRYRRT